jgi:hypothetical protein
MSAIARAGVDFPQRRAQPLGMLLRTPLAVAAVAFVLYAAFAIAATELHGPQSFAFVDPSRVATTHGSATIDAYAQPGSWGSYDGQYYLFIALDPARAWHYVDWPTYRYSRVLYPIVGHVASFGHPAWTPYVLIWINVLAVALGTFFVALCLARRGRSPRLAAFYFAFPGLFIAFTRDLAEPLAFALAAAGIWQLGDWQRSRRVALAALAFALAGLARETTLLIPLVLAGMHLVTSRRDWRAVVQSLVLAASAYVPYKAWTIVLQHWFDSGAAGVGVQKVSGYQPSLVPFGGLAQVIRSTDVWTVIGVAAPGGILLLACLIQLWKNWRDASLIAVVVSLLALVVFLPASNYVEYFGSARLQSGAVILALVSLDVLRRNRWSLALTRAAAVLAFVPWVLLVMASAHGGLRPV